MDGEREREVVMIRMRCDPCRRARGESTRREQRGEAPTAVLCPHYNVIWAPGYGPEGGSPLPRRFRRVRPRGPVLPPV